MLLLDLHTDFSGDRSGGLVLPSLSEFSIVYSEPHRKGFSIVNKAEIGVFSGTLLHIKYENPKAMPKNAQTTAQLHSSHMLVK